MSYNVPCSPSSKLTVLAHKKKVKIVKRFLLFLKERSTLKCTSYYFIDVFFLFLCWLWKMEWERERKLAVAYKSEGLLRGFLFCFSLFLCLFGMYHGKWIRKGCKQFQFADWHKALPKKLSHVFWRKKRMEGPAHSHASKLLLTVYTLQVEEYISIHTFYFFCKIFFCWNFVNITLLRWFVIILSWSLLSVHPL